MNNQINRRDLMKAAGAASSISLVGNVQARKPKKGPVQLVEVGENPVRFVEVGIEYELQDDHNYQRTNVDGHMGYTYDSNEERVILRHYSPGRAKKVFKNNRRVIGTLGVQPAPGRITSRDPVKTIPTRVVNGRRPVESVNLVEPHQPPRVAINEVNGNLALQVGDTQTPLGSKPETKYSLEPQTVTAETFRVTDEIVKFDDLPDELAGPRTEYDQVEVEVVPKVIVKDRGEVPVVEVQRP